MPSTPLAAPRARYRALLCLGLGVSVALAFWLTRQPWLYGDGGAMVRVVARAESQGSMPVWRHALYLPLCAGMLALFDSLRPDEACRAVSAVSGGVLAAACLWLCLLRAPGRSALLVSALLVTSPAVWFFSTTVEVHALHGATVAVAMLLVATTRGRRRAAAIALGPVLFFLAHESSWLLVPGWVVFAARRGGEKRFPAAIGLTLLGALLGMGAAALLKSRGFGAGHLSAVGLVERLRSGALDPRLLWSGVLAPHLGLSVLAAFSLRRDGLLLGAFWLPHALFTVAVFGDPNAGGYLMPVVCVLSLAAARSLTERPRTRWLVAPLLLVQLFLIHAVATDPGQEAARELRARRAAATHAALPDGGLLLCVEFSLQTVEGMVPGVNEINLWREVVDAAERGEPPEAFAERLTATLAGLVASDPRFAFDLSYGATLAEHREALSRVDALAARIQQRFPGIVLEVEGIRVFRASPPP